MNAERVVLVLGAGATVADCMNKPLRQRPPLDRGFFASALQTHGGPLRPVTQYMREQYGIDVRDPRYDSLERVMAVLYTDVFGGKLENEAFHAFRVLVKAFLSRLANTTNDVPMTRRCRLYRLVALFLNKRVLPEDLTIVTFNQDIQTEKALDRIAQTKHRANQKIFAFPRCYRIEPKMGLTSPVNPATPKFEQEESTADGIALLKLHGSINWYSAHNTPNPSRRALFDPRRQIGMTTRKTIDTAMRLTSRVAERRRFTFPIVIPPVVHKSGILHNDLQPVWTLAEERLKTADRVVIVGYSCPANDWESANLIGRSLNANSSCREISVVDPDPGVLLRYVQLGNLKGVSYFSSCDAYLAAE